MSKIISVRCREVDRSTFLAIKKGTKSVETRAATERYRDIKAGDILRFKCGADVFECRVRRAAIFKTITALVKKYGVRPLNPQCKSEKDLRAMYASFPGYSDKIKRYGLIALEL